MSLILPYQGIYPKISTQAFIAPNATIIGEVEIGKYSSIWFNCVIRGDVAAIKIGENTNVQDGSVIHVSRDGGDTIIGDNVTIGHMVLLHACRLMNNSFVGMGAIVMDGVVLEENAYIAAGSLVTNNKIIKSGEIWAGRPAKFFRKISPEEIDHIKISANNYVKLAADYKQS